MTEVMFYPCNDVFTSLLHILSANQYPDAECVAAILAEHFEALEELTTE